MKTNLLFLALLLALLGSTKPSEVTTTTDEARKILKGLSLKEKIGQKLMLDFRYWCDQRSRHDQTCNTDLTTINPDIAKILIQNHIGGVILFSNNMKSISQITTLTDSFQHAMFSAQKLPLLIATDQEGGIVARLPRDASVTFPGNMALAAAHLGHPDAAFTSRVSQIIALDIKAVGLNVDFAPDVDVNVNPQNPVINVRAFSDDPALVAELGLAFSRGIQAENVASTLKHFPGHGDTSTDSHIGLPVVTHTLTEAWQSDLYPFQYIIDRSPPDFIMSAHIQYPALDSSMILSSKSHEMLVTPATFSRTIQFNLLRQQLHYQGVVITDALDMGAIAQHFETADAVIKSFHAGVDVALMPVSISRPEDITKLAQLISAIELAVEHHEISEEELNESVLRIIKLKLKLGLLHTDETSLPQKISRAEMLLADPSQRDLENTITNNAMTLVQNENHVIPLRVDANTKIHILTPWLEQGAGIAAEIKNLQAAGIIPSSLSVTFVKVSDTTLEEEIKAIDQADVVIAGNATIKSLAAINLQLAPQPQKSLAFPAIPAGDNLRQPNHFFDDVLIREALRYAKSRGKTTIYISLLAPYDLPDYRHVADAMLAGYDFYGYLKEGEKAYFRGPSMPALARIIFGVSAAEAKLPINIPNPENPSDMLYKRGFGLTS